MLFWKIVIFALLAFIECIAEEWKVFSIPSPIYGSIEYDSGAVFATGGGIQFSTPRLKHLFTTADGLGANIFYGVAQNDSCIYGVSDYGLVVSYSKANRTWKVANKSFLIHKEFLVPGQVLATNKILVLAFENHLSFFDTQENVFILTIEKIKNISLTTKSPQEIAIKNDSLFVLLGNESFVRKMNWENLYSDMRLADPDSWEKWTPPKNSALFKSKVSIADSISKVVQRETLVNNYSLGNTYEFTPIANGGVVATNPDGWISYSDGYYWKDVTPIWNGIGNGAEPYNYRMKILSALDNNLLLAHVWGMGLFLFKDNGYSLYKAFTPQDENSCLDEILDDYTVAVGTTVAPDSSGFLAVTSKSNAYGLVYISKNGDISCLSEVGSSPYGGTLIATKDTTTNNWIVYVSSRENFHAHLGGSLDKFTITPPSRNGGRLSVTEKVNLPTPNSKAPIDFTFTKDKTLWLITIGNLAYLDNDKDTLIQPRSTNGLVGAEYTSIESDVQGNLWLGSTDQGVFRLSLKNKSKDTLTVTRFTTNNGLLSNMVHDVSIDPVLGMAWFAHDGGVTRYLRNDLRDASQFMTKEAEPVKVYPNPFRPKKGHVLTIDNISEDSFVSIYNHGGSLVKTFRNKEVLGGYAKWDGTDKTGKLVAPGVYHYVVRKGSKTKKGKIILIH